MEKKFVLNQLIYLIVSFFVIALLSFINGIYHLWDLQEIELKEVVIAFSYLIRYLGYAFIFFYLSNSLTNYLEIKGWYKWLLWINFATAILGFLQLIFYPDFFLMFVLYGWDPHQGRLLGTFFDPNLIGAFLSLNICVLLGVVLHDKKEIKINIFLLLVSFIALVLTLSRSAYLAFFCGFVLIAFMKSRKLLMIGFITIMIGLMLSPKVLDRVAQGVSVDESSQKHIESWVDGIHLISTYPLLGIGYNMLPSVYDDLGLVNEWDVNNRSGIENSLMTVWVTTGVFGFIFYMLIFGFILRKAFLNWRNQNEEEFFRGLNLGIIGGIMALFVSSFFVNSLFFSYIVVYVWFYAAFVFYPKILPRKPFLA